MYLKILVLKIFYQKPQKHWLFFFLFLVPFSFLVTLLVLPLKFVLIRIANAALQRLLHFGLLNSWTRWTHALYWGVILSLWKNEAKSMSQLSYHLNKHQFVWNQLNCKYKPTKSLKSMTTQALYYQVCLILWLGYPSWITLVEESVALWY